MKFPKALRPLANFGLTVLVVIFSDLGEKYSFFIAWVIMIFLLMFIDWNLKKVGKKEVTVTTVLQNVIISFIIVLFANISTLFLFAPLLELWIGYAPIEFIWWIMLSIGIIIFSRSFREVCKTDSFWERWI